MGESPAGFFASDNESDQFDLLSPWPAIGNAKKDLQGPPASGGLCVIGFLVSAERLAQYEDSQLAIDHRVDPWCDVSFARLVMVRSTDYERCAAPGTRRQSGKPRPKLS